MLDGFAEIWLDKEYYIWGAGKQGKRLLAHLGDKIKIKGFIDSNESKQNSMFHGHPVCSFENIKFGGTLKILVTSLYTAEIMAYLKESGLSENVDFCDWKKFLSVYYWYKHQKLFLYRGNISITSRCTLACEHCNLFMPLHKNPSHTNIIDLKAWIDNYFAYVDYVTVFDVAGGEPLLHPDIGELTRHLGEKWRDHVGEIQFFTNGTITPKEDILNILKKHDVEMIISDYRDSVPKVGMLVDRFVSALEKSSIRYRLKYFDSWVDFGFPDTRHDSPEDLKSIFKNCSCAHPGLYDYKLYYCTVQSSAERLGGHIGQDSDWIELTPYDENNKQRFLEFDSSIHPLGYVSFCGRCNGIGPLNKNFVPVAKQLTRIRL